MSKYNKYAKVLDLAFKEAVQKQRELLEKYNKALEESQLKLDHPEQYPLEEQIFQAKNKSALLAATEELKKVQTEIWPGFRATRDELTKLFHKEVDDDSMIRPEDVDQNGVVLLNSAALSVDEIEHLASLYCENQTMLRLIKERAQKMIGETESQSYKTRLQMVANKCSYNKPEQTLETWDKLVNNSKWYSMEELGHCNPLKNDKTVDYWERSDNQAMISDF